MSLAKTLKLKNAEYISYREQLFYVVALLPLLMVSVTFYGLRPIFLALTGIGTGLVVDYLCTRMRKASFFYNDFYAVGVGLSLTLLMPASVPYWVLIIGVCFAIGIVKHVFGGLNYMVFHPVATAFCFLALSWPEHILYYPKYGVKLPWFSQDISNLVAAPSAILKQSGVPYLSISELFLGNYSGILGGTAVLVVFACGLYLLMKKQINWYLPVTFLSTYTVLVFLFPRIITNSLDSVLYEVFSTPMLFLAFFILSDKRLIPAKEESQIFFGVFLGGLTLLYSYGSPMENAPLFAFILATPLSSYFDRILTPFLLNLSRETLAIYWKKFQQYLLEFFVQLAESEKVEDTRDSYIFTTDTEVNPQLMGPKMKFLDVGEETRASHSIKKTKPQPSATKSPVKQKGKTQASRPRTKNKKKTGKRR